MGLSQRKEKQKVGADPRNLGWSQDQNRFSFQYLSKLGWDPSKGLGLAEEGNKSHIKVARKLDASGIGRDRAMKEGREGAGPVGAGLEDVLKRLKSKVTGPIVFNDDGDAEDQVKKEADESDLASGTSTPIIAPAANRPLINSSRAKHLRSKRMAASSPAAMAEILGISASATASAAASGSSTPVNGLGYPHHDSASPTPELVVKQEEVDEDIKMETEEDDEEDGGKMTTSPLSVFEYFRQRLAQKQAQREGRVVPDLIFDRSKLPGNSDVAKGFEGKKVIFADDGEVKEVITPQSRSGAGEVTVKQEEQEDVKPVIKEEKSSKSKKTKETSEEKAARKAVEKAAKKAAKADKKALSSSRSTSISASTSSPNDSSSESEKRKSKKDKGKGKAIAESGTDDSEEASPAAAVGEDEVVSVKKEKKEKKEKSNKRKSGSDSEIVEGEKDGKKRKREERDADEGGEKEKRKKERK